MHAGEIAALLGVGTDVVTGELVSNGGAVGGKEDMSNQGQTALAAFLLTQDDTVRKTVTVKNGFPPGKEFKAQKDAMLAALATDAATTRL